MLDKIDDIDEIPYVFVKDYDPLMVTASIKKEKELAAIKSTIAEARRPKSARQARGNQLKKGWDSSATNPLTTKIIRPHSSYSRRPLSIELSEPFNEQKPPEQQPEPDQQNAKEISPKEKDKELNQFLRAQSEHSTFADLIRNGINSSEFLPYPTGGQQQINRVLFRHPSAPASRTANFVKRKVAVTSSHFERSIMLERQRQELLKEAQSFKKISGMLNSYGR